MRRVMAQGTFDILHPGHVHYLCESAALGDELYVVIGRDSRVGDRKDLFMDEESRRRVVEALKPVDEAILGSEGSIFDSVERIRPDVITIGHDQDYDTDALEADLAEAGFPDVEVVRIGPTDAEVVGSSSAVKAKLKRRVGEQPFESVDEDPSGGTDGPN